MKTIQTRFLIFLLCFFASVSQTAIARDATTNLFELMDKGGCVPSSLTNGSWTISSPPVGTHGELNWGDQLVFEQLDSGDNFSSKSAFAIWKNGALWLSDSGWQGSCVRSGDQSLYVVQGEIEVDGCMHELAIGRLDHNDELGNRVEIVFQNKFNRKVGACEHGGEIDPRHPGHAHGDND